MRMLRRAAWLAPIVALSASCGAGNGDEDVVSTLRIGVAAPVIRQSATPLALSYHRNALTREVLVTLGNDGRAAPRVIESWQASADGLTWRLKIRSGIRFHDGTAVTAGELLPRVRSALWSAQLGKIRNVFADGPEVLVVELKERFAFLPDDLAQTTADKTVRTTGAGGAVTSVTYGTGAYKVVSESANRVSVKAVENHYRGDPGIDQIDVELFPDQRNAWSALMRNLIDVLYEVSRDSIEFVRGESSVEVATFPRAYVYLLTFNLNHPPLANRSVRQALNQAVDRDSFVRIALSGEGEPAGGHIWPKHWAYDAAVQPPAYKPADAVRMMDAAGLKLQHPAGRMPSRLRLRCMVYEPFQQMALVIQRQLAEVDVDLELEVLELEPYVKRILTGQYETFLFEMTSGRTLLWPYMFWQSKTTFIKHGYSGADDVLDQMRNAVDDTALKTATGAFQRRLQEDPPAAFLAWGRVSRAVTRRFDMPETEDDIYQTITRWKPRLGKAGQLR